MTRIYRASDRITVKIDDVIVKLAPLSLHQKTEVQMAMLSGQKSLDIRQATKGLALAMKYTLKVIEGVEDSDGKDYKLQFDDQDLLTDSCVDELLNLELTKKLVLVCSSMVNGVPTHFTDERRNALEGVELVAPEKVDTEKKK